MATNSMMKNINIKDARLGKALENVEGKSSKEVDLSRTYSEIKGDRIKEIFGK